MKIESVVLKLGVPRKSVHFLENYHEENPSNDVTVDYYSLRLLLQAIEEGEKYLKTQIVPG